MCDQQDGCKRGSKGENKTGNKMLRAKRAQQGVDELKKTLLMTSEVLFCCEHITWQHSQSLNVVVSSV